MERDAGGRVTGSGEAKRPAQGLGSAADMEALQETNVRLVDTLQQLQRERAGDALEGVLAEVDRTISGMLTYVEDLRRTREKLVRGVQSVADRLAEIDTRAVLGPGEPVQPPGAGMEAQAQPVYEQQSAVIEPAIPSAPAQPVYEEQPAIVEPTSTSAEESSEDERRETSLPVDLVVHGCKNFELVGKLQAKVSGLAVVESMRVRRFHRGSLYMTVSHGAGDLAEALGGLDVGGKRLRVLENGAGRIEATFTGQV